LPTRDPLPGQGGILVSVATSDLDRGRSYLDRPLVRRKVAYPLIVAASTLPRLVVLLAERGAILPGFTHGEKSDDFARTFLDSGTFGFIPGFPSAYTQPLYSFFLIPLYETVGRTWPAVGGAQILVATATALLVYEIGRRWLTGWAGLIAALLTTLRPYSIWHDVHINREILDGLMAVGIMLITLALVRRRSLATAAALGVVLGLAILGNVRLTALPIVLAAFLVWVWGPSRRSFAGVAVIGASCVLILVPWATRNRVEVGCFALTTDARALWEANNERTLGVLRAGLWIDNVPLPAGFPPSAQDAGREYHRRGRVVRVRECRQVAFYREKVQAFWSQHPGEKVRLARQATMMLWSPNVSPSDTRGVAKSWLNTLRGSVEPIYVAPIFLLALFGLTCVPRRFAALCVVLLAYQWVVAMVFVGATRYRVPWDFIPALLAAAAVVELWTRYARSRRSRLGAADGSIAPM
jgi:hypothetical protein